MGIGILGQWLLLSLNWYQGVPPIPMDMMVNARAALEVLQEAKNRGVS